MKPIRKFRQRVLHDEPGVILNEFGAINDFYSTSERRDLLFHFMAQRFTLPQIKRIFDELNLGFIGFEFNSLKVDNS